MLICYLDESGNTGRRLDDPDQPIHLIAAVLVREDWVRVMDQPSTTRSDKAVRRLLERHVSPQICSFVPLWP